MKNPIAITIFATVALIAAILCIPVAAKKSNGSAIGAAGTNTAPKITPEEAMRRADERRARDAVKAAEAEAAELELELSTYNPDVRSYFLANPWIGKDLRETIVGKKIQIGMTKKMVEMSWGRPERKNETVTPRGKTSQWVYNNDYLYFNDDGILATYHLSR